MTTENIVSEALGLPRSIRAFVAEKLIESLDNDSTFELTAEWKTEVERRCREIDNGLATLLSAEDVFKRAYDRLT